ncbi:metallophosphoesterase family protein [Paenibacillus elgii]|uniref:metallophosphoesterase family protein n=1 Tax=Paenibacillus elgii TaxID=189691 RepID=UPI002D7DA55A|nr:metallophosphoesterase family protein [Paenibacillus elgii]
MKNRTLVISDIHGCYDEFVDLLSVIKFAPAEDKLILLGDYCDRGFKSKNVIEMIMNLHKEWNAVVLRGNHDQMFIDWFINKNEIAAFDFLQNGGLQTIESYCGLNWFEDKNFEMGLSKAREFIQNHYKHHIDFLKILPVYHETDEFIFVHAGLNPFYENWKEQPFDDFLWLRDIFINNMTQVNKTVVFGHTPTIHMQETEDVWFGDGKIGIDGGCCFGFQLNCLEISEEGYRTYFVESRSKRK